MYEYKMVNVSLEPVPDRGGPKATMESAANRWAQMGWRTVSAIPSKGPGYADTILVERLESNGKRRLAFRRRIPRI